MPPSSARHYDNSYDFMDVSLGRPKHSDACITISICTVAFMYVSPLYVVAIRILILLLRIRSCSFATCFPSPNTFQFRDVSSCYQVPTLDTLLATKKADLLASWSAMANCGKSICRPWTIIAGHTAISRCIYSRCVYIDGQNHIVVSQLQIVLRA